MTGIAVMWYVAAKSTSQDSWLGGRQRADFAWTKVTGGIRCCPAFVEDRERVNDIDDCLTVLEEWGTRKFFDMYRVADRAAKENIRL